MRDEYKDFRELPTALSAQVAGPARPGQKLITAGGWCTSPESSLNGLFILHSFDRDNTHDSGCCFAGCVSGVFR